jgi:acyl-CoA thioesterase FadM
MTTITQPSPVAALLGSSTDIRLRPHYEGSNICTWIGFKHVNYLVEEAVLEHFRRAGLPARSLYDDHGLGVDIVDLDTRIPAALHMDDDVRAAVTGIGGDDELRFAVALFVERDGAAVKAASSKVRVVLREDDWHGDPAPPPPELARFAAARIGPPDEPPAPGRGAPDGEAWLERLTAGENAFGWRWRIPYFYCHFTQRMQMSGYLRQMEEVVDLFLADRGISIWDLLDNRRWIPVVPHSRIEMLDEALMEEELYTVYTVEQIFKDFTYTSRMDCYVVRDGRLLKMATGTITHGYAVIENRRDWNLVHFDERVQGALRSAQGRS